MRSALVPQSSTGLGKMQLNLDVRPMQQGDSHHLLNIDLKASEFPFDFDDWQTLARFFPEWKIAVATLDDTPVAFAIYEIDEEEKVVRVHKIAALPNARRIGVDSTLLSAIEYTAVTQGMSAVEIPVPASSCRGKDDPYDVSVWLNRNKYRCVRTEAGLYEAYGDDEDGYIFQKPCTGQSK